MKPGDIIKVKLGHDVHEAEVIKENPKTVLVKVLWSKTRHRKVQADKAGQMSLFGTKVPYTVHGTKIVKIPKAKIVTSKALESPDVSKMIGKQLEVTVPELPPTPAPRETVDEEVLAPEAEYEGPGLGRDEAPMLDYEAATDLEGEHLEKVASKPDPFADLEAAIKKKGGN